MVKHGFCLVPRPIAPAHGDAVVVVYCHSFFCPSPHCPFPIIFPRSRPGVKLHSQLFDEASHVLCCLVRAFALLDGLANAPDDAEGCLQQREAL